MFRIVEFTPDDAEHHGDIRAVLEEMGKPIGPLDPLIAAQAGRLGAVLVTGNAAEFKRVKGLRIMHWKGTE